MDKTPEAEGGINRGFELFRAFAFEAYGEEIPEDQPLLAEYPGNLEEMLIVINECFNRDYYDLCGFAIEEAIFFVRDSDDSDLLLASVYNLGVVLHKDLSEKLKEMDTKSLQGDTRGEINETAAV